MSQNNINFEGSMSGASMLDDRLTPLLNNIYSSNSGSTRPAYLQAGGTWFDSPNGKLMLYNGVSEVALLTNSEDFANKDLSNLSEDGQAVIDGKTDLNLGNSTVITNCITSVPQNFKLEMNNGVLTLKAGSKVYDGAGNVIQIESDLTTIELSSKNQKCLLWYRVQDENIYLQAFTLEGDYMRSGNTTEQESMTTTDGIFFYNTETKLFYYFAGPNNTPIENWQVLNMSIPIAEVTTNDTGVASVDKVLDNFSYFGNTFFAFPSIKGLIPYGRNENRNVENVKLETTKLCTYTFDGTITLQKCYLFLYNSNDITINSDFIVSDSQPSDWSGKVWFDTVENFIKYKNPFSGTVIKVNGIMFGHCSVSNGRITSINPKFPFRCADENDLIYKADVGLSNVTTDGKSLSARWSMPNYDAGIVISGYNSVSNKFTAPCDGLILMCGGGTANNAFNLVIDDEVYLFNNASTTYWVGQQFFIKKGSTFYYMGVLPGYGYRHFFPLEGAQ